MKSPFSKSLKAFTLVEILAGVAIVGVLVALLVPAIQSFQTSALRAKNANNMRQIGAGVMSFTTENNGSYPGNVAPTDHGAGTHYAHLIFPYMGGNGTEVTVNQNGADVTILADSAAYRSPVFHSPATPQGTYLNGGSASGVYGANPQIFSNTELLSSVRVISVIRPAVTILLVEKNAQGSGAEIDPQGPFPQYPDGAAANLRNDRKPAADPRGSGPCGFLFADGHVENIDLESLRPPQGKAWPGDYTFNPVN